MVNSAESEELERSIGNLAPGHFRHTFEGFHALDDFFGNQSQLISAVADDPLRRATNESRGASNPRRSALIDETQGRRTRREKWSRPLAGIEAQRRLNSSAAMKAVVNQESS